MAARALMDAGVQKEASDMVTATRNGKETTGQATGDARIVLLPARNIQRWEVRIVGETPLITHRFGEDAIQAIQDAQGGAAKTKKPPRDPRREFEQGMYRLPDGGYGFPAAGVKLAMTIAGQREAGEKRTELMGRISIASEHLEIISDRPPEMRTDRVRLSGMAGVTSLAYRPVFWPWSMLVPIRFNANTIQLDQVLNILDIAGFSVGIGDWRVDRKGTFGQFSVDYDSIRQVA
jgi:hypothetical protein